MELESVDRQLLRLLQDDCRISNAELADKVGLSPSACWRRMRALQESGVIRTYVVVLNTREAGFGFSAITYISLAQHDKKAVEAFTQAIQTRAEVVECFSTTGDADFHLRVVARDADAYNEFLDNFLFTLPGVSRVRTNLILKEIKHTTALPV